LYTISVEEERRYSLAFSVFPGIGPYRFNHLVSFFGSVKAAYQASKNDLININLGEKLVFKFIDFRSKFNIDEYIRNLNLNHIGILLKTDSQYPKH
jgi:predicted Rossmann fold nucleotide-binding protein DprA/Smf involved in DNA uptake